MVDSFIDYRPIYTRTRSKREIAILKQYWKMKNNGVVIPLSRKKRRSNQFTHPGESSSRKQEFEWVADQVENQMNDYDLERLDSREDLTNKSGEKGKGAAVGLKRKRSLGVDASADSNKDWRVVSDNGIEVVELVDSDVDDDEVLVSKGKKGGGVDVDVDDVSDGGSDEDVDYVSDDEYDEDVSSPEGEYSSEETEFRTDVESTEDESDEEYFSDGECSEEEQEEETELSDNAKDCKEERVEVDLKRKINANEDDQHSSCVQDIDDTREKAIKGEDDEVGLEGTIMDGKYIQSSSSSEQEQEEEAELPDNEKNCKEESVEVGLKRMINDNGDGLRSSCGQDIEDLSGKVSKGEDVEVGLEAKLTDGEDIQSSFSNEQEQEEEAELPDNEKDCKDKSVEVGLKRKLNANGDDLHSSCGQHIDDISEKVIKRGNVEVDLEGKITDGDDIQSSSGHNLNEKSENLEQAETSLAEERTQCDRSDLYNNGRVWKKESFGVGSKGNRNGYVRNRCKKYEGDNCLTQKKSARATKQKWVPTVVFQPPKVECLPQRFSFAKPPTIPEKSDYEREVQTLFDEYDNALAFGEASIDSKDKANKLTRSDNNRNNINDEAYGGSSGKAISNGRMIDVQKAFKENEAARGNEDEMHGGTSEPGFDKSSKLDVQSACKKGVEAKGNNISKFSSTRKDDNGEACDVGRPEPYKKKEGVRKLNRKKGIRAPQNCDAFSILVDSIYDTGEVSEEKLRPFGVEPLKDEAPIDEALPKFFWLGHRPSPPPEKSPYEKELDKLFEEQNFAIMTGEIGSTDFNVVETNDTAPPSKEVTQHDLCNQGKHVLELDEEIGYICRFCSHVHLEIRYVMPDFAPNPYGKSVKRGFYEEDNRSILDDLQCNDHNDSGFSSQALTEGTVWDLIPGVENDMYPHQREGFEFIWKHIAGGIQLEELVQPSAYDGDGCIISHAPGTGKTRLTIIFIQSYMKFNPLSRPLIVAPRTMLLTWEEEFKKWGFDIPFHNLNNPDFTGKEDEAARNLVKDGKREDMVNLTRVVKLKSWAKTRSILGISYALFEQICGAPTKSGKDRERRKEEAEQMSKILLEFPGLVVFDEGHNPRNDQSHSWNALLLLKTRRRILLSGTPFQNNFDELYNTVRLVRPEWTTNLTCLGGFDKKQWSSYQVRGGNSNVKKDQFAADNTKRAREVKGMISHFVHVYKGTILQDKLPGLRNSVVILQPTALQQRYSDRTRKIKNPFKYERVEAKITIHPSLLLRSEERSMFHKEEEVSADWESLKDIELNPEGGVKARFTVALIRLCQAMNERVLVFSQWVSPLHLIRDQLRYHFNWKGGEIIYMDGKCDAKLRQSSMSDFNDPTSEAKVLLATTKGCNEGISLVGASRVVLLDVSWNPSVERQAISRAYRLGQKKVVYIYHLLMAGAREEDKYSLQVEKHRLSELVFSCSDAETAKKIPAAVAEDKILEEMVRQEKLKHIFQTITLLDEAKFLDEDFDEVL